MLGVVKYSEEYVNIITDNDLLLRCHGAEIRAGKV